MSSDRMPQDRYRSLDAIRGIAVMGILLMNITSFSMPEAAYLLPTAYGGTSWPDLLVWAMMMVLVDGKMRGLFSMLFGASMLLVYTRAEQAGGDARSVHMRRMGWLLVFGLAHYFLIWTGDILTLYALCGAVGMFLLRQDEDQLRYGAIALFLVNFVLMTVIVGSFFLIRYKAGLPGADADILAEYQDTMTNLAGSSKAIVEELARYRGGWLDMVRHVIREEASGPLLLMFGYGAETLGLFSLGMLFFRNGFLTGEWERARYADMARRCYLFGLPPLVALVVWDFAMGLDPVWNYLIVVALAMPFRLIVTIGHAALAMWLIKRLAGSGLLTRIEAAGQAAFTNYLGTSILMTGLFYGWGFGQFGHWSRWQIYLVVPLVWGLMLLWSKPWLNRFRYGPMEWLWRSLARGRGQPMRRLPN